MCCLEGRSRAWSRSKQAERCHGRGKVVIGRLAPSRIKSHGASSRTSGNEDDLARCSDDSEWCSRLSVCRDCPPWFILLALQALFLGSSLSRCIRNGGLHRMDAANAASLARLRRWDSWDVRRWEGGFLSVPSMELRAGSCQVGCSAVHGLRKHSGCILADVGPAGTPTSSIPLM
jgi:hypothetical protein